jgi:hypothetical protein
MECVAVAHFNDRDKSQIGYVKRFLAGLGIVVSRVEYGFRQVRFYFSSRDRHPETLEVLDWE